MLVALLFLGLVHGARAQEDSGNALSLAECVRVAVENNPALKAGGQEVIKMNYRVTESRAGFYPALSMQSDYRQYTVAGNNKEFEDYGAGFTARQNIFQGGKLIAQTKGAKAGLKAAEYQYESLRQDLIYRVQENYYRYLQKLRLVQVAEKAVERAKIRVDEANARYIAGVATRSDILKSEVDLSDAELKLIQADNAAMTAGGVLNNVLGYPVQNKIQIVDDLSNVIEDETRTPDELIGNAFKNRPEILGMTNQLDVQKYNIRIFKSEYLPSIVATASYDWSGESASDMDDYWFAGVSLELPLFNGFSTKAKVSESKAEQTALEYDLENLRQTVGLEVWNAYLRVRESRQAIDNTVKFLERANENLNISEGEYREGIGSMLEVIDAQTVLISAEESHINSLADHQIAIANLDRVIGISRFKETK
ncbi:MAG: TolC family protein [Calditrichaceae bacterium]